MTIALDADFRTAPYDHQLREFEGHAEEQARALLWQMRTGKSKLTVDTACHLAKRGLVDAVVLVAPNGVHENWTRRELVRHHWDTVPHRAIAWRSRTAGTAMANQNSWVSKRDKERWREEHAAWWDRAEAMLEDRGRLAWFAFNSESMTRDDVRRLISRVMRRRRVMAVFDESDDFGTPGSKRTKMARAFARRAAFRRILTGTVVTESPLAAFSQYELLEPGALGFSKYADFKARYAVYEQKTTRAGRNYPALKEYVRLDELRDSMARWSSVVLREDCEDLPDVEREELSVEPTEEQLRLYRELHREFLVEVGGREVSIGENTTRHIKLQQIMSGFLIDEYGEAHDLPGPNPRLEAASEQVYMAPGKVVVWCQFQEDIRRVAERLRADGHETVEYHGGVSDEDKQLALDRFQNDPSVKPLVGQPTSGGRGLDLSAAGMILNYSHTFRARAREQSKERATAVGGDNVRMVDIIMPGPDRYILGVTDAKVSVADDVAGRGLKEALELCRA